MDIKTFENIVIETFERTKGREQYEYGFSIVDGIQFKVRRYFEDNKRCYDIKLQNIWTKLHVMEMIK